ncbi:hypothetical protein TOK_4311 [Pseudonocardia sp. N23]|nr:hypothetical protein TOK_4311 [Pseudonocardia sp. N23]
MVSPPRWPHAVGARRSSVLDAVGAACAIRDAATEGDVMWAASSDE